MLRKTKPPPSGPKRRTQTRLHLVVPDTHTRPEDENITRALWVSRLIDELRPSTIIHLGDNWNLDSLADFDLDKPIARVSRNYQADLNAGHEFLDAMFSSVRKAKHRYSPRRIYCVGNHEYRLGKVLARQPELAGTIGYGDLDLPKYFDEIAWYEGTTPSVIVADGVSYCHHAVSGLMCRPISGTHIGYSLIQKLHSTTVVGHAHILSYAQTVIPSTNRRIHGLCSGIYIGEDTKFDYCGVGGKQYARGLSVLRNVEDGDFDFQWVSVGQMQRLYGGNAGRNLKP